MNPKSIAESLAHSLGQEVVLDTDTSLLYLGTLSAIDDFTVTLEGADVHDMKESSGSKEVYILEARRHGIQRNRHRVFVRAAHVISFSLLKDVILY